MHGTQLNYHLPPDLKTSWMQETKFNDKGNNLSSNVRCTSNKSNQKQNSESKLSNELPGTSYENKVNNQMGCLEVLTPNNENTIDKNFANVKIGESSCSKNAVNDSTLAKNYQPELLDSNIRLNKIIGKTANNDIAKGNECEIEKTKNSNTDRDLKIKRSMMNNKSKKDYNCPEINLKDITVNIPSNVNKDGVDSESEQNSILMDYTDQNKPKKQKHIKRSESCNSDISSKDKLTNNKPIIVEKTQEIKSKKPFLGPPSVKLARQKMEMERKNCQNERYIKNQFEFETKNVRKGSKSFDRLDKKGKLNSGTITKSITDDPNVLICPFQNSKSFYDETNCNKPVEQNSNTSTLIVNKPKIKKARLTELEKLHADISGWYGYKAVINDSKIRQCRISKKNYYVGVSKKNITSYVEQLDTNDDQNKFIHSVRHPKENVKKSTIKLNTKGQFIKNSITNKTLPPVMKTAVLNKMSNKQPPESNINENLPESNLLSLLPEQANQSPTKETRIERVKYSLRVRYLPGDRLSIHIPTSVGIRNLYDMASVNLNIKHGSNDKRFPLLSSRISDVKSLKKGIVKTSKINSCASDNDDLNTWMKAKTNCEVVLPNSEILLKAGQQIVNYGVPIDGTIYHLIDTAYTKDYIRKIRDFPMNVLKTQLAFNKMSALPRLLSLFKCMDRSCTQMFSSKEKFKLHMQLHYSKYAERKKKNQMYNVQQFKMCAYCFKAFDDEESLANHIAEKYTFCEYFCPYCFYRAYTASHVLVHLSVVHADINSKYIIKLDGSTSENPKEMLLVVDFKKFVLPYKCDVGCCGFSCYLHNEFVEHLNQEHQQCDKLYCYICADKDEGEGFFLHPTSIIAHFKHHHLNKYQCTFCLFGSETIDSMIEHLAFEHFEYEPLCLERSTVSDNCDSKNIRNLKILRLKQVIDNGMVRNVPVEKNSIPEFLPRRSKKRSIESPDNVSLVMKFARIDEGSQPSDTVAYTFPNSALMAESSTSMSLANDVNQNHMKESLKTTRIRSKSNNIKKKPNVSSKNDVVLSVRKELNVNPKKKCLEIDESVIELDKLFVCKECDKVFTDGVWYLSHLKVCPFWDSKTGRKCVHCPKNFKNKFNMTEHIKLHGPDRFKCCSCNLKIPSHRASRQHMRKCHGVKDIGLLPVNLNLTNIEKDFFILVQRTRTQEQLNYTKNSVNFSMPQKTTQLKIKDCSTITDNEDLHKESKHLGGRAKRVKMFESSNTIIFNDKRTSSSSTKEKNIALET